MRRIIHVVVAIAIVAFLLPARAEARDYNCWWFGVAGWDIPLYPEPSREIPVWLDTSTALGVQNSGHDTLSFSLAVQAAIGRINNDLAVPIRLVYKGPNSNPPTEGTIVVYGADPTTGLFCAGSNAEGLGAAIFEADGVIDRGWIAILRYTSDCTHEQTHVTYPMNLMDTLVHEVGHVIGRNDAYGASACDAPFSIMDSWWQDPSLSDLLEDQSSYGARPFGRLIQRKLSTLGGSWTAPATLSSMTHYTSPPGVSSSQDTATVSVMLRRIAFGAVNVDNHTYSHSGVLSYSHTTTTPVFPDRPSGPISIAHGGGRALMAFAAENNDSFTSGNNWYRRLCYAISSDGGSTFPTPTCLLLTQTLVIGNAVGVAYDPVVDKFWITWVKDFTVGLLLVDPTPGGPFQPERTFAEIGNVARRGVSVACRDYYVSGNYRCRLIYPAGNTHGQPLEWVEFDNPASNLISVGLTRTSTLYSEHAPALTYALGRFQMAYSRYDREIYHFDMSDTGTAWTLRNTLASSPIDSPKWVSPPTLVTTCSGSPCTERLHALWLDYEAL